MNDYLKRTEKIFLRINELAAISEDENSITRTFGTDAFLAGSKLVFSWMQEIGLQTRIDSIGNVRGRLESSNPGAKTFVIASHIDTVVNAGKFDGPLGVIMGLELLANLILNKTKLPFHIELIAFSDEEGVRFHTTFLGSRVVAGSFDATLLNKTDQSGFSLNTVTEAMGCKTDLLENDAIAPENWLGYFEIHIEQGPVLYEQNIPVALVTAIAGQKRIEISFTGMAGHAGTVPMTMRSDALTCAAEFTLAVEKFALHNSGIAATVGKLEIIDQASNVIPGKVIISLDLRSDDGEKLSSAYHSLKQLCLSIGDKRKIIINWSLIQETETVVCDPDLNDLLEKSITELDIKLVKLVSGAGHDGVCISKVSPICMLFVRCFKGISHNPLENAEIADVAQALQVSEKFINQLIKTHQN